MTKSLNDLDPDAEHKLTSRYSQKKLVTQNQQVHLFDYFLLVVDRKYSSYPEILKQVEIMKED